jgi:hypothetical protein
MGFLDRDAFAESARVALIWNWVRFAKLTTCVLARFTLVAPVDLPSLKDWEIQSSGDNSSNAFHGGTARGGRLRASGLLLAFGTLQRDLKVLISN